MAFVEVLASRLILADRLEDFFGRSVVTTRDLDADVSRREDKRSILERAFVRDECRNARTFEVSHDYIGVGKISAPRHSNEILIRVWRQAGGVWRQAGGFRRFEFSRAFGAMSCFVLILPTAVGAGFHGAVSLILLESIVYN